MVSKPKIPGVSGIDFICQADMPLVMKAVRISGPVDGDWVRLHYAIAHTAVRLDEMGAVVAALVLRSIAEQFDEMALAARNDDEYERRDVWRNAAEQARFRSKDAAWLDATIANIAKWESSNGQ